MIPFFKFKTSFKKIRDIDKWMIFSIIKKVIFGIVNIY